MREDHFDEPVAAGYDEGCADMFEAGVVGPTVDFLAALAGDGAALEFGVGTGRIALPLSERGVAVQGIDLSTAMVTRLRAKPGSDRVLTTIGDFATVRIEGAFRLVYLLFNTIMNLTTQSDQVACFANAAAHLEPGGYFVVEVGVPDLRRLPPGERIRPFAVTPGHLGFDEYTDLVEQTMFSHHYRVDDGALTMFSAPFRYVWPSELDLMARLAGLTRRERWAGWSRQPFTGESGSHVSVWQRPPF
jgi:SAM-dependent methyltransferase